MRNNRIYCAFNENKNIVFFIHINGRNYNLFTAPFYSSPVYKTYCEGVILEDVFKKTVNHRQQYVKDSIIKNIRILEEYLGTALLRSTKKKDKENRRKAKAYKYFLTEENTKKYAA